MKVLMFSTDYHPDSGGIAKHIYYLSRALCEEGIELTLIGGHRTVFSPEQVPVRENPRFREILIHRSGPKGWRTVKFLVKSFTELAKLSKETWDIIHLHNFYLDGILLGNFRWPKSKIRIMTNHSSLLLDRMDHHKGLTDLRLMTRTIDGFIAPSKELKEKTTQMLTIAVPVEYIPNGVDTVRFCPLAHDQRDQILSTTKSTNKIIIAVRRHELKCGIHLLIQAMPEVISNEPNAILWLIGEGDQTKHLKNITRDYGLEEHVFFLGTKSHDTLAYYYRSAYVSVLPSIYEAVSLAGLESLACGCPVIGANVGGIPDFVKDGETGLLVEANSIDSISSALIYLLANENMRNRMSKKGVDFVKKSFSWSMVAQKTIKFYKNMIDLKSGAA